MKGIGAILLAGALALPALASPPFVEVPLDGTDIAEILDLSAHKYQLRFDSPRKLTVQLTEGTHRQDFPLPAPVSEATFRLFLPQVTGADSERRGQFKISTKQGGMTGFLYVDPVKFTGSQTGFQGDDFVVTGYDAGPPRPAGSPVITPDELRKRPVLFELRVHAEKP